MNFKLRKTAAVLSFIIGAMAIFAGSQVMLGKIMDYYVIGWLPIYNFFVGTISVFSTIIIWNSSEIVMPVALAILASHVTVMLMLLTVYQDVVAPDSIKA